MALNLNQNLELAYWAQYAGKPAWAVARAESVHPNTVLKKRRQLAPLLAELKEVPLAERAEYVKFWWDVPTDAARQVAQAVNKGEKC